MSIRKLSLSLLLGTAICSPIPSFGHFFDPSETPCCEFADMYGPLQFTIEYSEKLGYFFDPKYINSITARDALSFEFGFGGSEFRGAISWGHAFSKDLFFKFSAEYFAQDTEFTFIGGDDTEWVGQSGFGADLQMKTHGIKGIYGFHLGAEYTVAENVGLDSIVLPMGAGTNERRIAGGRDYGATFGVFVTPWLDAIFDLNLHYDAVEWRNSYSPNTTISGFGASVAYHQLLGAHWKIYARGLDRQPYYEYIGKLSYLTDLGPGTRLEVGGHYKYSGGDVPLDKESRYGLSIFYTWGGNRYTSARPDYRGDVAYNLTRELVDYTNDPAVRPPQVLAISDETVIP